MGIKNQHIAPRPTLNSWKQVAPGIVREFHADLLALAASLTPCRSNAERDLLTEIVDADGFGATALARRLGRRGSESGLAWTWIALAATRARFVRAGTEDRPLAALLLARKLAALATEADSREAAFDQRPETSRGSELRHLSQAWMALVERNLPAGSAANDLLIGSAKWLHEGDFDTGVGQSLFAVLAETERPRASSSMQAAARSFDDDAAEGFAEKIGGAGRIDIPGPQLVVCQNLNIGHAKADDRALAKDWAFLAEPLPLASGPKPEMLASVLRAEFPWLGDAIDAMVGDLILRRHMGQAHVHWRPLLMVGPPGTGKTRLARRMAELAGTGFGEVNAAGSSDNRALQGTARGWGNANPSLVLHTLRQCRTANPVILVDEIDKAGGSERNGDIKQTLLTLLEPVTAKAWNDECLQSFCDLGQINWVLTANDVERLRGPLLTRLRVVYCPKPGANDHAALLAGIRRDLAAEFGVPIDALPELEPEVEEALARALARGISARRVRAAVETAMKVACQSAAPSRVMN